MTQLVVAALLAGAAWWAAPLPLARSRILAVQGRPGPSSMVDTWRHWSARWRRLRAGRHAPQRRAQAVVELAEVMAAELRAGQPPPAALAAAAEAVSAPVVDPTVVAAARAGGPVADLLDTAAGLPGAAGLHGVAACWRVAEQSGTGLAQGLERVVMGLRDDQLVAREVAGQLAAPRATGRLLAVLPAFGWLLGAGLGAAPLDVLLTSPFGWACLVLGVPLQLAGWWWMERLTRSVEPWRT